MFSEFTLPVKRNQKKRNKRSLVIMAAGIGSRFKGGVNSLTSEFLIPIEVNGMLHDDGVKVKVIPTPGQWYGMTFQEDVPAVQEALKQMAEKGLYPEPLLQL